MRVCAGCAVPAVTDGKVALVGAYRGGFASALLDINVLEAGMGIGGDGEYEAVLQRDPNFSGIEVLNVRGVLQRATGRRGFPFPSQAEAGIGAVVNEPHALTIDAGGL